MNELLRPIPIEEHLRTVEGVTDVEVMEVYFESVDLPSLYREENDSAQAEKPAAYLLTSEDTAIKKKAIKVVFSEANSPGSIEVCKFMRENGYSIIEMKIKNKTIVFTILPRQK